VPLPATAWVPREQRLQMGPFSGRRLIVDWLTPYDLARSACTSPSCPTLAATGTCS